MTKLGMTEYEARAYTGLVGLGEGTARQVHEACGVPRPRIYDILDSLETKGYVEVWQGKPKLYRAVPPDRLMRVLREQMEESIRVASSELTELSIKARQRTFPVWHIKGDLSIRDQVSTMLSDVKEDLIVLSPRPSTLRGLVKELRELSGRVDVLCMVLDEAEAFRTVLPEARIVEPDLKNDTLAETYVKIFTGKFEASDIRYRAELMLVVDGNRSLLVYEQNGERTAIVFEIPIIASLQSAAVNRLVEIGEFDWKR